MVAESLLQENERLLRFLYQVPSGLLMMRRDGTIEMLNPEATRLLVPVQPHLMNLFDALSGSAPELREDIAAFGAPSGLVWEQRRLRLKAQGANAPEVMVVVTIYRLESDAFMVSIQENSATLSFEQELLRSAEALRESEKRFRLMADSSPAMIWTSTADGSGDYYNRTWLDFTGRALEEEINDGWIEGIHPEDRDRAIAGYLKSLAEQGSLQEEYRMRRHDGAWRWVLDRAAPCFTPEGVFAGHIGSCVDITERIEATQAQAEAARAAAAANEAKSRFLATVSHEIRTPLTAILGLGELAASEPEDVRLREYVGLIRDAGTHLLALINDLLDVSKLEAGAVALDLRSEADVRAAWSRIADNVRGWGLEAPLEAMIVAEQASPGVELALGAQRDPECGLVFMAGAGGTLLELMKDVSFAATPMNRAKAADMLARTRAARLISGFRGSAPLDPAPVEKALLALGAMADDIGDCIAAIDINPFRLSGSGGWALDALIILRGS